MAGASQRTSGRGGMISKTLEFRVDRRAQLQPRYCAGLIGAAAEVSVQQVGDITLPGRKLFEVVRALRLPDGDAARVTPSTGLGAARTRQGD